MLKKIPSENYEPVLLWICSSLLFFSLLWCLVNVNIIFCWTSGSGSRKQSTSSFLPYYVTSEGPRRKHSAPDGSLQHNLHHNARKKDNRTSSLNVAPASAGWVKLEKLWVLLFLIRNLLFIADFPVPATPRICWRYYYYYQFIQL